jgi:hypothetical protein
MSKQEAARLIKHEPYKFGWALGFNKLKPVNNDFILHCWEGEKWKALQSFRGSYKSTSVISVGVIRQLILHPETRILIIRKTFTDAADFMKQISGLYESEFLVNFYREVIGVKIRKTEDNDKRITLNTKQGNTAQANITAYGIGDSITGAHADVVICDDVINLKDKTSAAHRRTTEDAVRELSANILDPDSRFIFLGTKWHRDDAWKVVERITDVKTYRASEYWERFFPARELELKKAALSPFLYAMNYELTFISDESLLFQNPKYGVFDPETWRRGRVYAHLDAAYGGADTCALTVMAEGHAAGWVYAGNVAEWYGFIRRKYDYYHCREILLETNADKGFLAKELTRMGFNVRTYNENTNKTVKISTYLYEAWKALVWDEETDPDYMNQILDWTAVGGGHDDAPDSAASLYRAVYAKGGGEMSAKTRAALFG